MRIAISGTHSVGKSTFVQDFLAAHPDYQFEEEPYRAIRHQHEIVFAEDQTQNHVMLQLNHCIESIKKYHPGDKVICDRCPIDYIPYSSYSIDHGRQDIDKKFVDSLYPLVKEVIGHLDLIVFVPISDEHPILLEVDGHRPPHDFYRDWVDEAFKELYRENLKTVISGKAPKVVEIVGDRQSRIKQLNEIIKSMGQN
ncbi:MAG TPA: ATP-binding protein [Gammaproteobacteria bacterium]|nr:ATP-binding protein [Gammaproteobacteria bacterium]